MLPVTALACSAFAPATASAVPGDLETSFGTGGKVVVTNFAPNNATFTAATIQPDGKIVVAGYAFQDGASADADFVVVRLTAAGVLDPMFGSGGIAVFPINLAPNANDFANAVAIGPGGSIVVAGEAELSAVSADFGVVRLTSAGLPDTTFSGDGTATVNVGAFDAAFAVEVQADGMIVAGGRGGSGLTLLRLEADGDPDPGFGTGGLAQTPLGGSALDLVSDLAIVTGGAIVAAGTADAATGATSDIALARYTTGGVLDGTFAGGGVVQTPGAAVEVADALAVQPDGSLVVAGTLNNLAGTLSFHLARYTSGGVLDGTFGTGGLVTTPITPAGAPAGASFAQATGIAIQPDGRIVVGGRAFTVFGAPGNEDVAIARYTAGGALDPTFGPGGYRTHAVGASTDVAFDLVLQTVPAGGGAVRELLGGPGGNRLRALLAGLTLDMAEYPSLIGVNLSDDPPTLPPLGPPLPPPPPCPPLRRIAGPASLAAIDCPAVPTAPQPCACTRLDAFVNHVALASLESTRLTLRINWRITCTAGAGRGCEGRVLVKGPRGAKFIKPPRRIAQVDCKGPCRKSARGSTDVTWLALGNPNLLPRNRAFKSFQFRIQTSCRTAKGVLAPPKAKTLTIAFGRLGFVDYKKSDLDGDGKPDGKQL